MVKSERIIFSTDASGAYNAAREGLLVMIVDVIDMSTTLESALDAGAFMILGASPDVNRAPVKVDPEGMGRLAAREAREGRRGIVLVAEPRAGTEKERITRCQKVIRGIESEKGLIEAIVPNLGAETPKLTEMKDRVVLAVTETGGVAYDAAFQAGGRVITGTVARTLTQKGLQPALSACKRARASFGAHHTGIAVIAASRNSLEDVLGAQYIAGLLLYNK